MDGQERIFISLAVAFPETKAAVVTLPRLQDVDIVFKARLTSSGVGISLALNAVRTSRKAAIEIIRDEICSEHSYG